MAIQRRHELGTVERDHTTLRKENGVWPAGRYGRRRRFARGGGALMRRIVLALLVGIASLAVLVTAPNQENSVAVLRASAGKPDLTGVWQGGSNVPGPWQEASSGLGLGGNGTNANVQGLRSASERPPGEAAPYQPWAAQKVLEFYKR